MTKPRQSSAKNPPKTRVPATKKRVARRRPKSNSRGEKPTVRGREVSISSTDMAMELIYGRFIVGGSITWAATGPRRGDLHLVVTLAGHQIDKVEGLYVDNRRVEFANSGPLFDWNTAIEPSPRAGWFSTEYANLVLMYAQNTGADNQDAMIQLIAETADWGRDLWTSDHRQLGCAHVWVQLKFSDSKWPDGLPDLSFLIRGKRVYDPRDGTTQWSQNAALIIADYIKDLTFGFGAPHDSIYWGTSASDIGSVWWAAQICIEQIPVPLGTVDRYQINGVIDSRMTPEQVLEEMADAIAGDIIFMEGKWRIYPGTYITPTLTLSEADVVSDIKIQTDISRSEKINGVRGQFINPWNLYDASDFPPYVNSFYQGQDGEPLYEDLTLNFVIQVDQAQRISKIFIERSRQSITVEATFSLKAYQLNVCDNVFLNFSRYGWTNKPFRIEDITLLFDEQEGLSVALVLHETAPGIYDWNNGDQTTYDLSPNSDLPNPFFVPVPSLTKIESGTNRLYIRHDGTVQSRMYVEWSLAEDQSLATGGHLNVYYRIAGDAEWIATPNISGGNTYVYLSDVQDGKVYEIELQAVNSLGVSSLRTQTFTHRVVGKTAPPSNVTNFRGTFASFGFALSWDPVLDLDLRDYEIRQFVDGNVWNDGDPSDWDEASIVSIVRGTSLAISLLASGTKRYAIKAIDTSGNESMEAAWFDFAVLAPPAPVGSGTFAGTEYVLSWGAVTSQFAIEDYEVRAGLEYEIAEIIGRTKATGYRAKATWGGLRRFWITAIDVAGNVGQSAYVDLIVEIPSQVNGLSAQVVDNNVWIRWQEPTTHSLPIDSYRVSKGDSFEGSALLAESSGTFFPFFEFVAGIYTYWVQPFDTAGNAGAVRSVSAQVSAPPDFYLDTDEILGKSEQVISIDNNPTTRADVGYFGTQFASTSNANIPMRGTGPFYFTFQSPYTGKFKEFRCWFKTDSKASPTTQEVNPSKATSVAYSGITTGGTPNYVINNYEVQLCADANGAPGAVLATITNALPNMINNNSANNMRTLTWSTAQNLIKDAIYHVKFVNKHATPTEAWLSINGHMMVGMPADLQMKTMQPTWYGTGQIKRFRISSNGSYQTNTPTLIIGYDLDNNGTTDRWFGVTHYGGNHARFSSSSSYVADGEVFGGATWLRQSLTPADTIDVTAISISAQRLSGTSGLTVNLKNSGGTLIESVTIPASQYLLPASYNLGGNPKPQWGTATFTTKRTLTGGQKYYIELSCASSTQYHVNSSIDLNASGYGWPSGASVDGLWGGAGGTGEVLQKSTNSGSTWGTYTAGGNSNNDLCYYFATETITTISTNDPVASSVAWIGENKFVPCTQNKSWEDWFETGLSGGGAWSLFDQPELHDYIDAILDANITTANGNVSSIASQGPAENVLTTASNYPVHSAAGDYITFNDNSTVLSSSSLSDTTIVEGSNDFTMFVVFTSDKVNNHYVANIDDASSNPGFGIRYFSGSWYAYCNNTGSGGNVSASASGYVANDKILIAVIKQGTTLKMSVMGTVTSGGTASGFTASRFIFNKAGTTSLQRVYAAVTLKSANAALIEKVEGVLAHAYGIASGLRSDHPYKSASPTSTTTYTNSLQDQIDAGATYFIEPMALTGTVTFKHDMGAVLTSATTVNLDWIFKQLKGTTLVDCTISTSIDDVTYTDFTKNVTQSVASNFRFVKVRFDCINDDEFSVATIENVHLVIMAKIATWQGQSTISSGEANSTGKLLPIPEDQRFVSITSVDISPIGNVAKFGTWDVPPGDYPTYVKCWMFDAAGSFISGPFSFLIRGIR